MHLTVIPAYGRDYKSKKAALTDWNADKDFYVATLGQEGYINRPEADAAMLTIGIRYNQQRSIFYVKPRSAKA
jgi:hypothetical protein